MKKVGISFLVVLAGVAIWYLGFKQDEYQVSFRVKGTPQSTYYDILKWRFWGETAIENVSNAEMHQFSEVHQKIQLQDTTLLLKWSVQAVNDSMTNVTVSARTKEYSIANKLGVLTGETVFTKSLKEELTKFRAEVNRFGLSYRIQIDGVVKTPPLQYFYVTDTGLRSQKAAKMITSNKEVYPSIGKYRVEKDGFPFLKVASWKLDKDSIFFDFGFPIRMSEQTADIKDSLLLEKKVKYGTMPSFKALKATFYGNYSKSDRAWFALLNYAKNHAIKVKNEPLEIFYNNPMQGGEDSNWKAEIFMPIAE